MREWSSAKRLVVLGLAVVFAGLVVGCIPKSSEGHSCGTAFWPDDSDEFAQEMDSLRADYGVLSSGVPDCGAARSETRNVALVLVGAGVLGLAGGWVVSGRRPRR